MDKRDFDDITYKLIRRMWDRSAAFGWFARSEHLPEVARDVDVALMELFVPGR